MNIDEINFFFDPYQIDIQKFDSSFVLKTIDKRISSTGQYSKDEYFEFIKNNTEELQILKSSLYIHYSEFFRNSLTFALLEQFVIPEIIRKKTNKKTREIRIWSTACAGGQEAYSIAILLHEILSRTEQKINYRIFASDINVEELEKAKNGVFSADELGNITIKRLNQFFTKKNDLYYISPELKKNIHFSKFDLISDKMLCPEASIFGDFDMVFCCNLLFYYNSEFRNIILDKIQNCISENGYLITGEAEKEIVKKYNFTNIIAPSAIFKRNISY